MTYIGSEEGKVNGGRKEQEKKVFRQSGRGNLSNNWKFGLVCLNIMFFNTSCVQETEHTHI